MIWFYLELHDQLLQALMSIVCRALQLVDQERNLYGIRYNDYVRYRAHCANKLHRLRVTLKMTHGKGREFKKLPPIDLDNIKDGHLQLLLFEAERAWAYAQELLLSSGLTSNGKIRHHGISRFRRAQSWSAQLLNHATSLFAESRISASNLVEIHVYSLMIRGRSYRIRDGFDEALDHLTSARHLLDLMIPNYTTSRDQALAAAFADEIGPEIRHCAHELGHLRAYDIDSIVTEVASRQAPILIPGYQQLVEALLTTHSGTEQARGDKKLEDLTWLGKPIPIRNPELVDILLRVQETSTKLGGDWSEGAKGNRSRGKIAAYDGVLQALNDAEVVARKLVEAKKYDTSQTYSQTHDIYFIHSYIMYQLLARRTQRDLLLVEALVEQITPKAKGQTTITVDARLYPAVVKLLDTVLQSLSQMRSQGIVDESPEISDAIDQRTSFTQAKRCLYLARMYASLKRYAETLALTQRSYLHIRETRSLLPAGSHPLQETTFYPLLPNPHLVQLENSLNNEEMEFKRDWFAYNGGTVSISSGQHKKPLFFDIALNYIELPMDRLLARAGKHPLPSMTEATMKTKAEVDVVPAEPEVPEPRHTARSGLGSLLGGWWGRR